MNIENYYAARMAEDAVRDVGHAPRDLTIEAVKHLGEAYGCRRTLLRLLPVEVFKY